MRATNLQTLTARTRQTAALHTSRYILKAEKPNATTAAAAISLLSEGNLGDSNGKKIEVTKLPFVRSSLSGSGIAEFVPKSTLFRKGLGLVKCPVPVEELMRIVSQFIKINRLSSGVSEELEDWRQDVLDTFNGNAQEITKVANILSQLSTNKALAYVLYKIAAEEGYPNAAYRYAVILGTQRIKVHGGRAVSTAILKNLVASNHPHSMITMADITLADNSVSSEKVKTAVDLLEKASSDFKVPMAAFKLGNIYREGKVVTKNYQKAIEWYKVSVKHGGGSDGHFMLGTMYSLGKGTADGQPDYSQAFKSFESAALAGNVEAKYNLGLYYLEGKGTEKNPGLAVEYWALAAASRFPFAMLNLGKLLAEGKEVPADKRRARELLQGAIEVGDPAGFIASQAKPLLDKLKQEKKRGTGCVVM